MKRFRSGIGRPRAVTWYHDKYDEKYHRQEETKRARKIPDDQGR